MLEDFFNKYEKYLNALDTAFDSNEIEKQREAIKVLKELSDSDAEARLALLALVDEPGSKGYFASEAFSKTLPFPEFGTMQMPESIFNAFIDSVVNLTHKEIDNSKGDSNKEISFLMHEAMNKFRKSLWGGYLIQEYGLDENYFNMIETVFEIYIPKKPIRK